MFEHQTLNVGPADRLQLEIKPGFGTRLAGLFYIEGEPVRDALGAGSAASGRTSGRLEYIFHSQRVFDPQIDWDYPRTTARRKNIGYFLSAKMEVQVGLARAVVVSLKISRSPVINDQRPAVGLDDLGVAEPRAEGGSLGVAALGKRRPGIRSGTTLGAATITALTGQVYVLV